MPNSEIDVINDQLGAYYLLIHFFFSFFLHAFVKAPGKCGSVICKTDTSSWALVLDSEHEFEPAVCVPLLLQLPENPEEGRYLRLRSRNSGVFYLDTEARLFELRDFYSVVSVFVLPRPMVARVNQVRRRRRAREAHHINETRG